MMTWILAQAANTPASRLIELLLIAALGAVVVLLVLAFRDVLKLLAQLTRQVQNLAEQVAALESSEATTPSTTTMQVPAPSPTTIPVSVVMPQPVPQVVVTPVPGVAQRPVMSPGLSPQLMAVIAAAATAAMGGPGKQVVVKRITRKAVTAPSAWAEMGRVLVHAGRNVPRG